MKKIGILLMSQMLCFALFAQEVHYLLPDGTYRFEEEVIYNFNILSIEEQGGKLGKEAAVSYILGDYLSTHSMGVVSENDYFLHVIEVTDSNQEKYKVLVDDLIRENRNQELHDRINGIWVVAHTFDVLKANKLDELLRYEPFWKTEWRTSVGEEWEDDYFPSYMTVTDNYVYISSYATGYRFYLIQNDVKDDRCTCYTTERFVYGRTVVAKNDFMSKLEGKEKEDFCFEFDGDYLSLCIMENEKQKKLNTFIKVRNYEEYLEIEKQVRSIAQGYKADLSKITWPRHADGMCDYDSTNNNAAEAVDTPATEHTKSSMEAVIQKPAPTVGKTAVVTENLRLRTGDKATAQVVTTLAAGARVKVETMGKEETIDGIASNWAQIRVLDGAKDKNGNTIEAGTKGWLFGGYLSEMESAESERANEEASTAKESSVLPIVPIAAGGAVFAILLAVVILTIAKKKKYEKK
ncbi:MAG: SH3 domain-containing protein [Treponemataceae bacterium]|nr:SH3 domain-containing protein [Treponemataceae bacterium]